MRRMLIPCLALLVAFPAASSPASAQHDTASAADLEKELALLRRDLRAEKKRLIALNVPLTDTEATKFWPLYEQYSTETSKLYDEQLSLIKDYAAKQDSLTDAEASRIIKRWSDVQVRQAQTRQKYIPLFEQVIPGRKVARFFQLDHRIQLLVDLQLASEIPLVVQ